MNYEHLKLVTNRHKSLRSPCQYVKDINSEVRPFIPYLIRAMRKEDGIGICANQVGINKSVFITNVPGDHIRIFINPILEYAGGGEILTHEGCLSFKDRYLARQRKRHVVVRALNLKGEQFVVDSSYKIYSKKVSMLISICLQHELDHIAGIDMRPYITS